MSDCRTITSSRPGWRVVQADNSDVVEETHPAPYVGRLAVSCARWNGADYFVAHSGSRAIYTRVGYFDWRDGRLVPVDQRSRRRAIPPEALAAAEHLIRQMGWNP